MAEHIPLRQDPYVLAHRYREFMVEHPRRFLEKCNPYYEKLLANLPNPDADATDNRSRAIRYAKKHYECYYEIRDVRRIVQWLPPADEELSSLHV
jgi:hypothetical protein